MRHLILASLLAVAATGCPDDSPDVHPLPPPDMGSGSGIDACNPITQAGCSTGEKCTWLVDAVMPQYIGHIGCAPAGIKTVNDGCAYGAPGDSGFDDCGAGLVCSNYRGGTGVCKSVCDPSSASTGCDGSHVCVTYDGLFSQGATAAPAGGVCDTACDPLADNDFDGSGALTKKGTTCGTGMGCYGYPSFGTPPATGWSCTSDINADVGQPTGLRHRVKCDATTGCTEADNQIYVNSCNQGYLPLLYEQSGSTDVVCVAMCKPLNCYQGNCGTNNDNRLGAAPNRCNAVDRVGSFNTAQGGEHCEFLWSREVDDSGNFLQSATSDAVGFCVDHSKYKYDSDGDNKPDTALPACATLPDGFGSGSAFGAADLGCVDSTHAMAATGKKLSHRTFDEPRPMYSRPVAKSSL